MSVQFYGRSYELVVGTDLSNGRVFVDMRDVETGAFILCAWRSETTGRLTFDAYELGVPMEALSYFLRVADETLSAENWPLG